METLIGLSFLLMFASVACAAWWLMPDRSRQAIRQRVIAQMPEGNRPTLWGQMAELLAPLNRRLPTGWYYTHVQRRLEAAGLRMSAAHFFAMQQCGLLAGAVICFVLTGSWRVDPFWLGFSLFTGAMLPYLWLGNQVQGRRQTFGRDLPEIVDLLSLCVEAGVDFMNALGRVVKGYRSCPTTEELGLVLQEVRVGKRRRDALRAFATRIQTTEASSFARTLIQADRMGTSIGESLRILSEDMRIQRYQWAERFAQQAPLKMLLPLLFSLAAALIIVAGPILIQFLQGGFTTQFGGGGPQ